jgi:hypothetical protein
MQESGKIFLNTFFLREVMDRYLLKPFQFESVLIADRGALLAREVTPQHPTLLVDVSTNHKTIPIFN